MQNVVSRLFGALLIATGALWKLTMAGNVCRGSA
jgi:hypothetical protein